MRSSRRIILGCKRRVTLWSCGIGLGFGIKCGRGVVQWTWRRRGGWVCEGRGDRVSDADDGARLGSALPNWANGRSKHVWSLIVGDACERSGSIGFKFPAQSFFCGQRRGVASSCSFRQTSHAFQKRGS